MAHLKKTTWKKIRKGTSGLQVRVRDFVRKLRPERVRWQWRHLLASVDHHWPPTTHSAHNVPQTLHSDTTSDGIQKLPVLDCDTEVTEITATAERCSGPHLAADQPMSSLTQLPVASTDEEVSRTGVEVGGNGGGSVRPNELSLGGGGGSLVPPTSLTPRNKSPVTVQEWVDSLPLTPTDNEVNRGEEESEPRIVLTQDTDDNLTLGAEAGLMCGPLPPAVQVTSHREPSESGSHCSSVESLLEARRADPEEVLMSLGFGGSSAAGECRIPQRFLQPSKLKGVAIDDFLRHQQEMVTNFETGFCGYRGLSGPSHTMPSVIVAKIMEKLREHERESCSIASPPRASTNTDRNNRFSRVARNVLTTIKSPGNSVLTPDNRAWLDSQGHKSPEVGRKRIIIGQQSFTFSRDGDLIESPPSSLTDSDRWTSSTGTPGQHRSELALDKPVFPSIQETGEPSTPPSPTSRANPFPLSSLPKHAFANVVTSLLAEKNQESKLSTSSVEARSVGDSGLPSSGRSSRGLDDCDSPENTPVADSTTATPATAEHPLDSIFEEGNSSRTALKESPSYATPIDSGKHSVTIPLIQVSDQSSKENGESQDLTLVSKSSEILTESGNLSSHRSEKSKDGTQLKSVNILFDKQNDSLQSSKNPPALAKSNYFENYRGTDDFNDKNDSTFVEKIGSNLQKANCFVNLPLYSESSDRASEKSFSSLELESKVLLESVLKDSTSLENSERSNVHPSLHSSDVSTLSCSSPFPSLASELEHVQQTMGHFEDREGSVDVSVNKNVHVLNSSESSKAQVARESHAIASAPVRVIESLDKVIESLEKIMEPLEVIAESDLQLNSAFRSQSDRGKLLHSYEDLKLLAKQLSEAGVAVDAGTADQFLSLTVNERCELQCRVVRQALSTYQAQLMLDSSHYELKCCLGAEVTRLSDLLDTAADPDKLHTLVRQMSELLRHQAELSSELREWTGQSSNDSPGCHQLCEVVLRRLRALELLVHRNTRALSDLRNQVSH